MADFDDLLSSTRKSAPAPVFDNPFQDVFDGVAGRRSPDPWSTGGWGDPDPVPVSSHRALTPPLSPGGFREFGHSDVFHRQDEPESPIAATAADHHEPEPAPEPERPPLDPLASVLQEAEEVPVKRNPLGPLPPAPRLPPPEPEPTKEESSKDAPPAPSAALTAAQDVPESITVIEPSPTTAQPPNDTPAETPEQPALSIPDQTSTTNGSRIVPPIPASPLTPHVPTPSSSSGFSNDSIRDRSSNNSLAATDSVQNIKYDRIVSPLDTPTSALAKKTSLEQGFSNLALGGEVPGWGGFSQTYPEPARDGGFNGEGFGGQERLADSVSPDQSVTTVKEDEENESEAEEPHGPLQPQPVFIITVGDPQKVGDPISAHIVYTVHTRTTSPAFSKSTFSVLRRYSDFLWLYETLSANNPGVIVPPVPEKNSFSVSRFESEFVESRRLGLNKCVQKIANHPVLSKDEDFQFFLESDSFALDIKHRRAEGSQTGGILGTLGSLAAPRFYEIDDWFDNKRAYLDALESQLKGLVKTIEIVAKQRADFTVAVGEFADTIAALSVSDLSKQLTNSLSVLADVERLYKDLQDSQAKDDMMTIMGTADEYSRLINSVRLSFNSRIKLYFAWQSADTESRRVKSAQEKARRQGRSTGSMAEIAEAERRATEAKREFDTVTKLIKMELGRFETERVEDFKVAMEQFLEGMIRKQKSLIQAWENYQSVLLKKTGQNPGASNADGVEAEAI